MRYLLAFFGEKQDFDDRDEEAFRAEMDAWSAFDAETVDKGAYVACEGLQPSDTATTLEITEGGERVVTDGPYAETKEQLGGFTLLECESREEALEWAQKVPLPAGWKIEIRPVMDFTPFGYVDPTAEKVAAS